VHPDLHPRIVDTLVGNVFTDLTPLYKALDKAARGGDVLIDAATARSTYRAAVRAVP